MAQNDGYRSIPTDDPSNSKLTKESEAHDQAPVEPNDQQRDAKLIS